jgi:hypothetical protein
MMGCGCGAASALGLTIDWMICATGSMLTPLPAMSLRVPNDADDIDLTGVTLAKSISPVDQFKFESIVVDDAHWRFLLDSCEFFYAIVYTANGIAAGNCRKLVTANTRGLFPKSCEVRLVENVHTKLYILTGTCYRFWVGSSNLVFGDKWHNIMLNVSHKDQIRELKAYWEYMWNKAKP